MKLIAKATGIKLTSEERKIIEDLANNCESICESYSCPDCPLADSCRHTDAPHEVLTRLLDVLTEE